MSEVSRMVARCLRVVADRVLRLRHLQLLVEKNRKSRHIVFVLAVTSTSQARV